MLDEFMMSLINNDQNLAAKIEKCPEDRHFELCLKASEGKVKDSMLNPELDDDQFRVIMYSSWDTSGYDDGSFTGDQMAYIDFLHVSCPEAVNTCCNKDLSVDDMKKIVADIMSAKARKMVSANLVEAGLMSPAM